MRNPVFSLIGVWEEKVLFRFLLDGNRFSIFIYVLKKQFKKGHIAHISRCLFNQSEPDHCRKPLSIKTYT